MAAEQKGEFACVWCKARKLRGVEMACATAARARVAACGGGGVRGGGACLVAPTDFGVIFGDDMQDRNVIGSLQAREADISINPPHSPPREGAAGNAVRASERPLHVCSNAGRCLAVQSGARGCCCVRGGADHQRCGEHHGGESLWAAPGARPRATPPQLGR